MKFVMTGILRFARCASLPRAPHGVSGGLPGSRGAEGRAIDVAHASEGVNGLARRIGDVLNVLLDQITHVETVLKGTDANDAASPKPLLIVCGRAAPASGVAFALVAFLWDAWG
jgi:hypothetical protein